MADLRESILSEGRNLGCEACFWHVSVWTAAYHQVKRSLLLMFCQILNAVFFLFPRSASSPTTAPAAAPSRRSGPSSSSASTTPTIASARAPARTLSTARGTSSTRPPTSGSPSRCTSPTTPRPATGCQTRGRSRRGGESTTHHNLAQTYKNSLDFLQVLWRELQAAQAHQGHLGPGQPVQPLPQHRQQGRELLHRMNNSRVTSGMTSSLEKCSQRQQL